MHVERYLQDRQHIAQQIATMRRPSQGGIAVHTHEIAEHLTAIAGQIKLHLALEDQVLYPELSRVAKPGMASLAAHYQSELMALSESFTAFVEHWRVASRTEVDPEGFRRDAKVVLKALHERLQRENAEFFPAVAEL